MPSAAPVTGRYELRLATALASEEGIMTVNRTTISGIQGMPRALAGLEVPTGVRRRAGDAALAVVAIALLVLIAL